MRVLTSGDDGQLAFGAVRELKNHGIEEWIGTSRADFHIAS